MLKRTILFLKKRNKEIKEINKRKSENLTRKSW
jgi:hypothetical protein